MEQQLKLDMQMPEEGYALLVPCYNAAPYVDVFLESLAELTPGFDEVIFYDDASTDDTVALLERHGMRVIAANTNNGPGYARNRLAEAASCIYLHFHDIDDSFNPVFLTLVKHRLAAVPADVVVGEADWIDSKTKEPLIQWRYNEDELLKNPLSYFITHPLGIINTVYTKSAFFKINGFNEKIKCWEDADLHVRLAASGARFTVINEVLAYSLRHENGVSRDQGRCWNCRISFLEMYLKNYRTQLSGDIFTLELEKAKNALIGMGCYAYLHAVIRLVKLYHVPLKTGSIAVLFRLNQVLPSFFISKGLTFFYQLKKRF